MKKKIIIPLITLLLIITCVNTYLPQRVKADSGFDNSYSSEGIIDSSNDSSSSDEVASYDDSKSNSREDRESTVSGTRRSCETEGCKKVDKVMSIIAFAIILIIPTIVVITVIIEIFRKINKKVSTYGVESKDDFSNELYYKMDLSEEKIRETIPEFNKEEFINAAFNTYKKVQEDWMNFNYEGLRENLTDELYNQYIMQLESLKSKNEKNIMEEITNIKTIITDVYESNNTYTVNTEMIIQLKDYIEQNGQVIRGVAMYPITVHYKMTFVTSKNQNDRCPNCGAQLKENGSQICEYCRGTIDRIGNKWILSKKESIKQR